jgi:hypothetical protein
LAIENAKSFGARTICQILILHRRFHKGMQQSLETVCNIQLVPVFISIGFL